MPGCHRYFFPYLDFLSICLYPLIFLGCLLHVKREAMEMFPCTRELRTAGTGCMQCWGHSEASVRGASPPSPTLALALAPGVRSSPPCLGSSSAHEVNSTSS